MLKRIVTSSRSILPRRVVALGSVRYIETGTGRGSQSKSFGSVSFSSSPSYLRRGLPFHRYSQKEKAHEGQYQFLTYNSLPIYQIPSTDQYVREKEKEKLKKLLENVCPSSIISIVNMATPRILNLFLC